MSRLRERYEVFRRRAFRFYCLFRNPMSVIPTYQYIDSLEFYKGGALWKPFNRILCEYTHFHARPLAMAFRLFRMRGYEYVWWEDLLVAYSRCKKYLENE